MTEFLRDDCLKDVLLEFARGIRKSKGNLDDRLLSGNVEADGKAGVAADSPLTQIFAELLLSPAS
ncbi:MAG TPA: hypothetical protein VMO26_17955 [Vicinamibacterales bacterium]|nr:hypothetical protein [Vicinamibacterales bacterium]